MKTNDFQATSFGCYGSTYVFYDLCARGFINYQKSKVMKKIEAIIRKTKIRRCGRRGML